MRHPAYRLCGFLAAVATTVACSPAARTTAGGTTPVLTGASATAGPRAVRTHAAGIEINCHGGADKVSITLDKWKVRAGPSDAIVFQMKGNPNAADYFQVTWKRPDPAWPLDASTYTIPSGGSVTARVRADAVNGTFAYNINFFCEGNGTPPQVYTGVIDPDIIISGGTTRDTTQN